MFMKNSGRVFRLAITACVFAASSTVLAQPPQIQPDTAPAAQGKVAVDSNLPAYEPVSGVSGTVAGIGSDSMGTLMAFWGEGFKKVYPDATVTYQPLGSSNAPTALAEGTAQLGPMSRAMKAEEIENFEKKHGFKPTQIGVALDALSVFVNKDNPIEKLSFPEIDAIFSKTRIAAQKASLNDDIATWGQLGLTAEWQTLPISLYGRNSASGTYGFFKEHALGKGDFKDTVKEQPGSAAVVQGVTEDKAGIGYSGTGYMTSGVKVLPLSLTKDGEAFEGNYENVLSGKYPLSRMLYIYVAKAPNKPLDMTVKEFLKFILSKEGQQVVIKDNYLPLPLNLLEKQRALLD